MFTLKIHPKLLLILIAQLTQFTYAKTSMRLRQACTIQCLVANFINDSFKQKAVEEKRHPF